MKLTFQRKMINCLLLGSFLFVSIGFISDTRISNTFSYLRYDVEMQGKVIGWMTSSKTISPDNTEIKFIIQSKVNVAVFSKFEVDYSLESTFKNNFLQFSRLVNVINRDTENYTRVHWDGIRYNTWDRNDNKYINAQKIIFSIGCIYFKEPVGLSNLFSEKYLTFCPIIKEGDYYVASFPDGNKTVYKYQNGICVWAESRQKLFKIVFRLKEIH